MSYDQKLAMLLNEVSNGHGCKIGQINIEGAVEFIEGLKRLVREKKRPHITRSAEILKEEWDIDIPRRRLSDHIRGECGCQKS